MYDPSRPLRFLWLTCQALTVFLDAALSKKYTNPSSDTLLVLAGLDDADTVMTDFVATLDTVIRNGRSIAVRLKAVRAALVMTASAFHTGLPSYFTHRDLFPSLMKVCYSSFALSCCYSQI
jgi:hypothetical protein